MSRRQRIGLRRHPVAEVRPGCRSDVAATGPGRVPVEAQWHDVRQAGFRARFDRVAMTSPERAAKQILAAVERDRRRALIGPDAKVIDLVSRLPAGLYQRVVVAGAKRRR